MALARTTNTWACRGVNVQRRAALWPFWHEAILALYTCAENPLCHIPDDHQFTGGESDGAGAFCLRTHYSDRGGFLLLLMQGSEHMDGQQNELIFNFSHVHTNGILGVTTHSRIVVNSSIQCVSTQFGFPPLTMAVVKIRRCLLLCMRRGFEPRASLLQFVRSLVRSVSPGGQD